MMRSRGGKWTADEDQALKKLYEAGYSCSQIAVDMGNSLTRNAIIGRVHRLGLPLRGQVRGAAHPKTNVQRVRAARRKTEVVKIVRANKNGDLRLFVSPTLELAELRCVEVLPRNISLADLEPGDCRYPYGDGPFTFCGHSGMEGISYCGPHFALSVGRGTTSERAAHHVSKRLETAWS